MFIVKEMPKENEEQQEVNSQLDHIWIELNVLANTLQLVFNSLSFGTWSIFSPFLCPLSLTHTRANK